MLYLYHCKVTRRQLNATLASRQDFCWTRGYNCGPDWAQTWHYLHKNYEQKKCTMIMVSGAKERTQILCTGLFSRSQNVGTCCYHILCLDQTLFLFRTDVIMPGKQFVWYLETPLRINGPSVDVLRWREIVFFSFSLTTLGWHTLTSGSWSGK